MKYLYILTTFLFTISCLPSNKLDDSNQKILSEIIKEHDVLMEKMGELKNEPRSLLAMIQLFFIFQAPFLQE